MVQHENNVVKLIICDAYGKSMYSQLRFYDCPLKSKNKTHFVPVTYCTGFLNLEQISQQTVLHRWVSVQVVQGRESWRDLRQNLPQSLKHPTSTSSVSAFLSACFYSQIISWWHHHFPTYSSRTFTRASLLSLSTRNRPVSVFFGSKDNVTQPSISLHNVFTVGDETGKVWLDCKEKVA